MSDSLDDLMGRHGDKVREVSNFLVESPYFYKSDSEYLFYFLRRHQKAFARFFKLYFGWTLYIDAKCARVYKDRWYNEAVWPSHRELFTFTRRDECIGFMLLLEFFEHQIDIQGVTVDDKDNLRFRYGDLLEYEFTRFQELFEEEQKRQLYSEEYIRARILHAIMPKLEKYRFLKKIPPPKNEEISLQDTLYEALPALYHYNANRLSKGIFEVYEDTEKSQDGDVDQDDEETQEEQDNDDPNRDVSHAGDDHDEEALRAEMDETEVRGAS